MRSSQTKNANLEDVAIEGAEPPVLLAEGVLKSVRAGSL
jgi:hypothetical protein